MATEACRDWRGDLAIEALGQLEEPERTTLLAHVDGCADCRAALAELSTVARALDLTDASAIGERELADPPPELGDRILGRIQWERTARRRRSRGVTAAIAAVVAAAVVAVVLAFSAQSTNHGTTVALQSTKQGVHARAVLFNESAETRVQLHVSGLDDGEWYWLWVTGANGQRVGAGTFVASRAAQSVTMTAALSKDRTKRVWVTDAKDHVVLDGRLSSS